MDMGLEAGASKHPSHETVWNPHDMALERNAQKIGAPFNFTQVGRMSSQLDNKPVIEPTHGTPRALTAADGWSIAIAVIVVAVFLLIVGYEKKADFRVGAGLFLLFAIIYVPLTYIGLRTARLHGALRHFFCLTAAPLYGALFMVSMIWLFDTFPFLEKHLVQSLAAGGRRAGMTQGVLSGLLSAIVFWLWYRILKLLDRVIYRQKAADATHNLQPLAPADEASPAVGREP